MSRQRGIPLSCSPAAAAAEDRIHFAPATRASRRSRLHHQKNTSEAFEEMIQKSRARFVAMAYSILRDKEDAEDAVQNALLSAYLHLRTFEGRSALTTWFTRIVMNAALMLRRKRMSSRFVSLTDPESNEEIPSWEQIPASTPDPEKAYGDEEALQKINAHLAKMRPALRQAFQMSFYNELSNDEARLLLKIPVSTFKARLFRARHMVVRGFSRRKRSLVASAEQRSDSRLKGNTPIAPVAA